MADRILADHDSKDLASMSTARSVLFVLAGQELDAGNYANWRILHTAIERLSWTTPADHEAAQKLLKRAMEEKRLREVIRVADGLPDVSYEEAMAGLEMMRTAKVVAFESTWHRQQRPYVPGAYPRQPAPEERRQSARVFWRRFAFWVRQEEQPWPTAR